LSVPERRVTARDGIRLWATEHEDDLDPLFQEFHVILYDIRNRRRSDSVPPTGEVGIPVELDDIEAVCNSFGVTSFSLMGWSYVGAEAALFAARQPAGLQRVAMICPIPPRELPPNEAMKRYQLLYDQALADLDAFRATLTREDQLDAGRMAKAFCDAVTPLALGDPANYVNRRSDPSRFPNEWPDYMRGALERAWETFAVEGYDFRPVVSEVTAPILVVHGDADRMPIEGSLEWAASLQNSRLVQLPGVGHFPFFEAADDLYPVLSAFLSEG
jgi:pimeloyl-ACP methyl ester carboxylesterase